MFEEKRYLQKPLRWGMIGGGKGSEIGYAHRSAAERDGLFKLTAAALDIDPKRGRKFAADLNLQPERVYDNYRDLIQGEARRPDGIQALSIASPNNTHYEICAAALKAGLHVICEKPLTNDLKQARALQKLATSKKRILAVMYGYSGYVMVEQMRRMVAEGKLGKTRIIHMQFAHGHFASAKEKTSNNARWRMTPEIGGQSYALADIGSHAFQMGQLVGNLSVEKLLCQRQSFVKGRAPLEDNAYVMLYYKGGAVGHMWASAVNIGSTHGFKIRIIGEKASLEWWDEHPNQLIHARLDGTVETLQAGSDYLHPAAGFNRIGAGHPEGFFDSWANLYRRFGLHIGGVANKFKDGSYYYPSVHDGVEGVTFIDRCVQSADNGGKWVKF